MIKEKFLTFLYWIKDHALFLLEVMVRLSVGLRKEKNESNNNNIPHEDEERKEN